MPVVAVKVVVCAEVLRRKVRRFWPLFACPSIQHDRCSVESMALEMNRCVTPVGKLEFLTQAASVIAEVRDLY